MRRRQPFVSNVRGDQHEPSPFLQYRRSSASVGSALPSSGRSVFVSRLTSSAIGSQASLPAGPMRVPESTLVETQRDVEGLVWPSRITSSARRLRFASKCCINGISVRRLILGRAGPFGLDAIVGASASVLWLLHGGRT